MLVPIQLPKALPGDPLCLIRAIHATPGESFGPGDGILDFSADLGAGQSFDCPPIVHYRLALAETGRLVQLDVQEGQEVAPDAVVGMLEVEDEAGDGDSLRSARVNLASILNYDDWWDEL